MGGKKRSLRFHVAIHDGRKYAIRIVHGVEKEVLSDAPLLRKDVLGCYHASYSRSLIIK
jgi:hypothetical protein